MEQRTRLREIGTDDFDPHQQAQRQGEPVAPANNASLQLLMLALKTLSQRSLVAIAAIRGMILAGTVFWAAMSILPDPNTYKLTGLTIYSVFILILQLGGRQK